ncbi:MAG TPA: hypothetical protein VKR58_12615, partial [Aquella sp.]|nr:hypothetical protein [Aquella sp.]
FFILFVVLFLCISNVLAKAAYWRCPNFEINDDVHRLMGLSHDVKSLRVGFCYDDSGYGYTSLSGNKQLIFIKPEHKVSDEMILDEMHMLLHNDSIGGLINILDTNNLYSVDAVFGYFDRDLIKKMAYSFIKENPRSLEWTISIFKIDSTEALIDEDIKVMPCSQLGTYESCLPPGKEPKLIKAGPNHLNIQHAAIPYPFVVDEPR